MRTNMAAPNAASGARHTSIARQANGTFTERGIDEETLEIRAIEVTSSSIGDSPVLPDLLDQIAPDKCHDAIAAHDAFAVISPRKNANP